MSLPRVLVAHNFYQWPGGEDGVVAAETDLLRSHGHEVESLLRYNEQIPVASRAERLRAARDCVWSVASARAMRETVQRFRPDIIHVHNTLAALSPSIYWAAAEFGVPLVQTLHNYRLACPQGMFLREGRVCQECLDRLPLPAVRHACYRGSRAQSLAVVAMLVTHRVAGTWSSKIRRYIALSEFCREEFVRAGLPRDRIRIKPNFTRAPANFEVSSAAPAAAGRLLFVGRMSVEKGISVLAEALGGAPDLSCTAVGDGPERAVFDGIANVRLTGWIDAAAVSGYMQEAEALILPSIWYEPFPLVAVEAMAHGLPVIASRIGSLPEIVREGKTGLLFEPGNARDLAGKMRWAHENPAEMQRMGRAARAQHQKLFSAQENYRQLLAIYHDAIAATPV